MTAVVAFVSRARVIFSSVAPPFGLVATLLIGGVAAVRGQSSLDGFDPKANGQVFVVMIQPDGKVLLGGDFTTVSPNGSLPVTRNHIARLNSDGTLDTAFNPNANGNFVNAIAVQADGKVLVAGDFTNIGGQPRNKIARLDASSGLADSFDPNPDGGVSTIAVQADGEILMGGRFSNIGGQSRNYIARLDRTTGQADSFDPNASFWVDVIAVQPDGKIVVGGEFFGPNSIGGQARNRIARLDPKTGLADSFDPNASSTVASLALQADGKVLAGGLFLTVSGGSHQHIVRLDATSGLADPSFNPAISDVRAIAVQPDGKIVVGGFFTSIGGQPRHGIGRIDPATGMADSFNASMDDGGALSVAVQADGKILAGGVFSTVNGRSRNYVARVQSDGTLDQTLNLVMEGFSVFATAVQPDGKVIIGGQFSEVLGVARHNIARLNTNGTLDLVFNPNAIPNLIGVVQAIAIQADGKILVGGDFTGIGAQPRNRIARLDSTNGLADSFNPNANDNVGSIVVQPDGKILVGGHFNGANSIGGQTRNRIARLDPITGLADSFDPNASNYVLTVARQADGKVLAGGAFTTIGGQTRHYIARLDATTGLADSFDPNASSQLASIVPQPDGRIIVNGDFTSIGGMPRRGIARLDPETGLADSFDPNSNNGGGRSIAIQADGKILIGGLFDSIGGQMRNNIARLDSATGLADSFNPNSNGVVYSTALLPDGKVLAGGGFNSIGGTRRTLFARLNNDTAALQELTVTPTAVTWMRNCASPQFARVTFEFSTDNVTYAPLGDATANGNSWELKGLTFPGGQNFYVRARGHYGTGLFNGSESLIESTRNAFIPGPASTPSPTPTATATMPPSPTPTATATLPPSPTPTPTPPAQALNLSTRMLVRVGDEAGIGGFIITGNGPKQVLLRGIGPSLGQFGVPNPLADPTMELHGSSGLIRSNDNWRDTQEAEIQATGLAPSNDLESAIQVTLDAGNYTAVVRGKDDTIGVGLVEVYDLGQANGKLGNISTRAYVSTDADIMIAGFILGGNTGTDAIILRGIGPSLGAFGVPNPLADPTLELRDNNGAVIIANDNWMDDPKQAALIEAAGLAPTNSLESAIAATLAPGTYTALLAGKNNGVGNGLVEIYDRGNSSGETTPSPTPTASATATIEPTATATVTATATPTATSTGTQTPTPVPSPVCVRFEGFDDITTLPNDGWVQINHSSTPGLTNWFQGNGAVFPAQSGASASYIAANFNNNRNAGAIPPSASQPDTPPSPTPPPPNSISNWLLSPPITLQNGARVIFHTRTVDVPQFPDRLQVRMSTNGASTDVGSGAFEVGDFGTLMLDINPDQTTAGYPNVWTEYTATVSGLGSPTTGRFAFRYFVVDGGPHGANGDYIGIDTVTLSCTIPTPTPSPSPLPTPTPGPLNQLSRYDHD